jgi:hypothetical protein
MNEARTSFPDVSDVLAQKDRRRRKAAARSFGEKIAIVEAMRERLLPMKLARQARQHQISTSDGAKAGREEAQ